jgi:hypothetical protein
MGFRGQGRAMTTYDPRGEVSMCIIVKWTLACAYLSFLSAQHDYVRDKRSSRYKKHIRMHRYQPVCQADHCLEFVLGPSSELSQPG